MNLNIYRDFQICISVPLSLTLHVSKFFVFFFPVSVLLSKMLVPSRHIEAEAATGGCTIQISALKNFANFTEKHLCWSFVLIISCNPEAKAKFAQTSKSIKIS